MGTPRKILLKKDLRETCWDSAYIRSSYVTPRATAQALSVGIDGRCVEIMAYRLYRA